MEKNSYKLIDVIKRHNKSTDKDYFLAIVLYKSEYDYDILRILVNEEIRDKLISDMKNTNFNIGSHISVQYNTYNKQFQPVIVY